MNTNVSYMWGRVRAPAIPRSLHPSRSSATAEGRRLDSSAETRWLALPGGQAGSRVTLYSRHGHVLTPRFPTISAAVARLPAKSVTLDGEIVQVGERGIDFYAITGKQARNVSLMAFDILSLDGKDLRLLPLQERLAQLEMLVLSAGKLAGIGSAPSFDDGQALMNARMEHSLESVVSK